MFILFLRHFYGNSVNSRINIFKALSTLLLKMSRKHYRASLGAAVSASTTLNLEDNQDEDFPLLMSTKQRKKRIKQKQKNLSDVEIERRKWNNQLYLHDLGRYPSFSIP